MKNMWSMDDENVKIDKQQLRWQIFDPGTMRMTKLTNNNKDGQIYDPGTMRMTKLTNNIKD